MVEVRKYTLPPTALIPNSPRPLLHYRNILVVDDPNLPVTVHDLFSRNGWEAQWLVRYGPSQRSHYHSAVHECMAVLSGSATIRFGVADIAPNLEDNAHGSGREEGGIEVEAQVGDVFIIPAGVAHKTYDPSPAMAFERLTPGDGHSLGTEEEVRRLLSGVKLSGFTMIGAYPNTGSQWDFAQGGEDVGNYEAVWSVPKPGSDPVLGVADEGLQGQW